MLHGIPANSKKPMENSKTGVSQLENPQPTDTKLNVGDDDGEITCSN